VRGKGVGEGKELKLKFHLRRCDSTSPNSRSIS
jgi:hypothetical protein